MYKVSVIVPVYNTRKYLEDCINSITSQTYHNLEIILVDDGSTDESPRMCDSFALKDNRIIVIHQKNGGLSAARNKGLDSASGDFILFVDSDDYIEQDAVETLVKTQLQTEADMVIFNFYGKFYKPFDKSNDFCYGEEAVKRVFQHIAYVSSCTRFCHRKIYDNIRFPVGLNFEDKFICADIMMAAKKIYTLDKPLYFYREVETGITGSSISSKHMDAFYAYNNLFRIVKEKQFNSCIFSAKQEFLYFFVSMYGAFHPETEADVQVKETIKKEFVKIRKELWQDNSLVNKISVILLSVNPYLANYIFKVYRYFLKRF